MRHFFHNIDKSLLIYSLISFSLLFVAFLSRIPSVSAGNEDFENSISEISDYHHVTIYDNNKKIIVKTDSKTIKELLDRTKIEISEFDTVEPSLDSEINADNFFVNIYRAHPVVISEGLTKKYFMTASFDPRTIAKDAGFTIFDDDEVVLTRNLQLLEHGIASTYEIKRGAGTKVTIEEEMPFTEETYKDYSLGAGKTEVKQLGEVGKKLLVYNIKYQDSVEVSKELISETIIAEPVTRITAIGADPIEMNPLTPSKGRNRYTVTKTDGSIIERQETYYDLDMSLVVKYRQKDGCGNGTYSVREDGVKIDNEGYVMVAANLDRYPLCSVVQTSLGQGKVYDTGTFAMSNPEQFDIATDWTNRNGR